MLIRIHLVARLLKVPLLRIDGDIWLRDDDTLRIPPRRTSEVTSGPGWPAGRLLAQAEADLLDVDRHRGNGSSDGVTRRTA